MTLSNYKNCKVWALLFFFIFSSVYFFSQDELNSYGAFLNSISHRMIREADVFSSIKPTMLKLLQDENPFVRIAAAKYLIKSGDEHGRGMSVLTAYGVNPAPDIRLAVAKAYLDLGILDLGKPILYNLASPSSSLSSQDPKILLQVAELLLSTRERDDIGFALMVLEGLRRSDDSEVKEKATFILTDYAEKENMQELLGNLYRERGNSQKVIEYINDMVKSDYYPGELQELVRFLEEIPFSDRLSDGEKDNIHYALVSTLNNIDMNKSVFDNNKPFCFEWAIDILVKLTKSPISKIDFMAYQAIRNWGEYYLNHREEVIIQFISARDNDISYSLLGRLDEARDKIVDRLIEALFDDRNSDMTKEIILEALAYWGVGSKKAKDTLQDFRQSPYVGKNLINYALKMHKLLEEHEEGFNSYIAGERSRLEHGMYWSINTLYDIGGLWIIYGLEDASLFLSNVITNTNLQAPVFIRAIAMGFLGFHKEENSISVQNLFLNLLLSDEVGIYQKAVEVLSRPQWINETKVRRGLLEVLNREKIDYNTKLDIAEALIKNGSPGDREKAVEFLLNLALDESLQADLAKYRSTAVKILTLALDS